MTLWALLFLAAGLVSQPSFTLDILPWWDSRFVWMVVVKSLVKIECDASEDALVPGWRLRRSLALICLVRRRCCCG